MSTALSLLSDPSEIASAESRPQDFNPEELLSKADADFREAAETAHIYRDETEIKLRFFRSDQHQLRRSDRQSNYQNVDDRVEFETVPLIRATIRQAVALFIKNLPQVSLLPRGSDVVRRQQARQAGQFVNGLSTCDPEFYEALYSGKSLAEITGGAWHKVTWDPNKTILGAPGAPTYEYLSRLDAFPNPRATNSRTIYRMYHQKLMPREVAAELFPADWQDQRIDPTEFDLSDNQYPNFGDESQTPVLRGGRSPSTQPVKIIECWLKPSPRYPFGGMIAWSGRRILALPLTADGRPSLPDGYWPWTLITGLNKVPGRLIPDGLEHDLIPLQMTINRLASANKEAFVNSSMNYLLSPHEADIQIDDFDDMSGTIIKHRAGYDPKWLQAPSINQGNMLALDRMMEWYDQCSTQLDAARGITNGQNNAKLMAVQTELGGTIHAPDLTMWAMELAEIYKKVLSCVAANATEEHYLALLGANGKPTFSAFNPEIFHPDYAFTYVPGFEAPASREVQEAKILEAATAKLFDDTPAALAARRKMRWIASDSDLNDPKEAHLRRVEMEQVLLVTEGSLPTLLDRDDDETHLDQDEPFSISPEFLALPPELQQGYLDHMMMHQQQLEAKQQGFALQAATLGGGAGAGAPGGPPIPGQEEQRGAESPWSGGASPGADATTGDEFSAGEISSAANR